MSFCACFCVLFFGFEANIVLLLGLYFHALQSNYIENNSWGKRRYGIFFTSLQLDISQVSAVIFHILQAMYRRKTVKMVNLGKEIENDDN